MNEVFRTRVRFPAPPLTKPAKLRAFCFGPGYASLLRQPGVAMLGAMAADPARVLDSALALPARDRARLAHELLVSLDTGSDADAADAWVAELENRAREVRSGAVATEDWETVRARLVDRWRRR